MSRYSIDTDYFYDMACMQSEFENEQAREEIYEIMCREESAKKEITGAKIFEFVTEYLSDKKQDYVEVDEILSASYHWFGENNFVHDRTIEHWRAFYENSKPNLLGMKIDLTESEYDNIVQSYKKTGNIKYWRILQNCRILCKPTK